MPKKVKNTLTPIGKYIIAKQDIEKVASLIIEIDETDTTNKKVHVIVESIGEDVEKVKVGDEVIFTSSPTVMAIEVGEGNKLVFTENDVCAIKG